MVTRTSCMLIGLLVVSGMASGASAQLLDGEYWKTTLSGKTRIIEDVGEPAAEGDPSARQLVKGKLPKTVAYLLSSWDQEEECYQLTVWTDAGAGNWLATPNIGDIEPFGEGYPDTKNATFEMLLNLNQGAGEGNGANILDVGGLVTLKVKTDKAGSTGRDEVQLIQLGNAIGGTYQLSFEGQITAAIQFNDGAAAIQSALEALTNIGANNVVVESFASIGEGGAAYTITFIGALGDQDVERLAVEIDDTIDGDGVITSNVSQGKAPGDPTMKSGSFKMDGTGATMDGEDFGQENSDMIGSPKFSAKRVREDQLPFDV
jgi:hypothetical protein